MPSKAPLWAGVVLAAATTAAACELALEFKSALGALVFVGTVSVVLVVSFFYFRPTAGDAMTARVGVSLMTGSIFMPLWLDHGRAVIAVLHPLRLSSLVLVVTLIVCERRRSTWGWMPASVWLMGCFAALLGFLLSSAFAPNASTMGFVPWAWIAGGAGAGCVVLASLQRLWGRRGSFPWGPAWISLGATAAVLWAFVVAMSTLVLPLVRTWAWLPATCGGALTFSLARERKPPMRSD